jgi:phosphoglycolate phosphatase-like HAD superfamily hydrolase
MQLVLFDIDGTLLRTGGAGRRTLDRIFLDRFGVADAFSVIRPDGMTDPAIFREMLRRHGVSSPDEDEVVTEIRRRYEAEFLDELVSSPAALMPGARELVEALAARSDVVLGLLTGNLERTGRAKVEHLGLGRYFPFGAFSSDHEDRDRLPPVAVARAEAHLARPIGLGRHVVIVGDTPRDVACALAHGCTAIGVGQARYSEAELAAAGAHRTLPNLTDLDVAMAALTGSQ